MRKNSTSTHYLPIILSCLGIFMVFKTYTYLTHTKKPDISISGINSQDIQSGRVNCSILANNSYKINRINITLDNKKLDVMGSENIRARKFVLPIEIDTEALPNGQHVLMVTAIDGSYHQNKSHISLPFYTDNTPLNS